jgi:putative transposase
MPILIPSQHKAQSRKLHFKTEPLFGATRQEDACLCYDICVEALQEALNKGRPDIFNTDQGAQFTGEAFTGLLEQHGVRISMDGKGSYNDNLFIERLWRTVKYEEVYLKAYQDGRDARVGLGNYFRFYNTQRPHQALGYRTPAEVLTSIPVEDTSRGMVESLTSDPLRIAGPNLNLALILS